MVLASIKYCRVHFLFLTQHFQSWLPPVSSLVFCGERPGCDTGPVHPRGFLSGRHSWNPCPLHSWGRLWHPGCCWRHRSPPASSPNLHILHSVSYTHVATSILTSGLYDSPHDSNIIPSFYNLIYLIYIHVFIFYFFLNYNKETK